jgi:ATP-dependent DNA helicase PIF1
MSAAWIALGFQTYPTPIPSVTTLYPRDETFVNFHNSQGRICDIGVYLERPVDDFHLTFTEWFSTYSYSLKRPTRRNEQYTEKEMLCGKSIFISERSQTRKPIVYMYKFSSSIGEAFYLRMLLKRVPTTSFGYLKIVNNVELETYQQSAIARGFVEDYNELKEIFDEIILESNPKNRRATFALLTLQGYLTRQLYSEHFYKNALIQDFVEDGVPLNQAINNFLSDLKLRLEDGGRTMEDYGFPAPTSTTTVLERERLRFNQIEMINLLANLNARYPSTDEQERFLNAVHDAISTTASTSPPKVFMLQGSGGVGKSNSLLKLIAKARSVGKLVLGCAATGVAAAQFDDFLTAHKLFELPVIDPQSRELNTELRYESNLKSKPEKLELLQEANVIVWDEIFTNTRECLDAAAQVLSNFVGKVIVLVGDVKQMLGIPHEDSFECLTDSLVLNSAIFKKARKFEFTLNMRMLRAADFTASELARYQKYLRTTELIGLGLFNETNVIQSPVPTLKRDNYSLILTDMPYVTYDGQMLDHLYPDGWSPENAVGTMMLAATNEKVSEWNNKIQELNPNAAYFLNSKNEFADHDDDYGKLTTMLNDVNMTNADKPDGPPHILKLKIGDIVMLTHTLSRREKLCKNRLLQVLEIRPRHIKVRLAASSLNEAHLIPRTRTRLSFHKGLDMAITRTQYPFRLAYSCTYNKSQSATLHRVGLDITHDLFAHGHLYVGLTRATNPSNILFYTHEDKLSDFSDIPSLHRKLQVNNIVHKNFIKQVCQQAYDN